MQAIWTLPSGDTDFPTRWRLIKTFFSKSLLETEWRSEVHKARRERGISCSDPFNWFPGLPLSPPSPAHGRIVPLLDPRRAPAFGTGSGTSDRTLRCPCSLTSE
jgi:hypothetical protein